MSNIQFFQMRQARGEMNLTNTDASMSYVALRRLECRDNFFTNAFRYAFGSLLHHNSSVRQKAKNTRVRKAGAFEFVELWKNNKSQCIAKIGAGEVAMFEPCCFEIAAIERGLGKVGFVEKSFVNRTLNELRFAQRYFLKNRIIQNALAKCNRENILRAFAKIESQQFAIVEFGIHQHRFVEFAHTEIASNKMAIVESETTQIDSGK